LEIQEDSTDRIVLRSHLRNSRFRSHLEIEGYDVIAFETGYYWTEFKNADVYFQRSNKGFGFQLLSGANGFEILFLRSTILSVLLDSITNLQSKLFPLQEQQNRNQYERILFVLDTLEEIPDMPGPKFVFVHLLSPHPPYVLNSDGSFKARGNVDIGRNEFDQYQEDYLDQVKYLNSRLPILLEHIIDRSDVEPIIIVQSDTGPKEVSTVQRMRILNAVLFSEYNRHGFYKSMSPINTFRLLMSTYFGVEYKRLEDVSYFSTYEYPFEFEEIP
jgi:hypothetical protein